MSRPTRARGLKSEVETERGIMLKSRPTRARGLKSVKQWQQWAECGRAPRGRVD